jgi:hypothetical protein
MDLGRLATCARCGKQFKLLLENHDEMRCIAALREENARLWALSAQRGEDREMLANENLRLRAALAEVERLQGDIAALKNVLRGDESQMKQWQNRNLEMRNDLDRTVLARDEARAEVERLKSGDAWQLLSRQLENALAEVAAVVQWHLNRNDEDGCCEDGLLCSLGQLLAPEVK